MNFIYSGHQSFSLRISWLPKAVAAIESGSDPFTDPRQGMRILGLGKNMVEALEFWVKATGVAVKAGEKWSLTEFASLVISREKGFDPFLENQQTLWLLHWNLCNGWMESGELRRPYAWHFFSNVYLDDEIIATEAVDHFAGAISNQPKPLSAVTLRQHFEVFIRTYVAGERAGPRSTPEDALDSPLTILSLIKRNGEKKMSNGRREAVYRINSTAKPGISEETFRYCLQNWWDNAYPEEQLLMLRDISYSAGSPGRVFHIPESDVYGKLLTLATQYPQEWKLVESQNQRGILRLARCNQYDLLRSIYRH